MGTVLRTVLVPGLEQVDIAWIFYAFSSIDECLSSWSAKSALPQEKCVRRCCPWRSRFEGTVVLVGGHSFSFFGFSFSFSMIFLFLSLNFLSPKGSWDIKAARMYWGGLFLFNITVISFCWSQQKVSGVIPMLNTFHVCPTATYIFEVRKKENNPCFSSEYFTARFHFALFLLMFLL